MAWTAQDELNLRAHLLEIERLERRNSILAYTSRVYPAYQAGAIHYQLAEALEWFSDAVRAGEAPRLIIEAPPRAGKSFLCTERFCAFHLGRNPHHRVIQASHTFGLSATFSRAILRQVQSAEYREIFPECSFLRGGDREWETSMLGSFRAAGVGVGITGLGADVLLVDDPIKDWREAMSQKRRDALAEWFFATSRARINPGGGIMITATRWHPGDLTGVVLAQAQKQGGGRWRVLSFPAIATKDDSYRKAGESFDAKRFPLEGPGGLLETREDIPSMVWASLYQQQPTNAEGTIFLRKWGLRRHAPGGIGADFPTPAPGDCELLVASWDMAFAKTNDSDYVVGQVWGKIGANYFLLDQVRGRMNFPESVKAVQMLNAKWPMTTAILVEQKANGQAVVDSLRESVERLILVNPEGGKEARATAASFAFEAGNVVAPTQQASPWVSEWEHELYAFPRVDYDDQVDATSQALNHMRQAAGQAFWFLG